MIFRTWLWNIARGINGEEVEGRLLPKSHGSGKLFPGPQALKTIASVSVLSLACVKTILFVDMDKLQFTHAFTFSFFEGILMLLLVTKSSVICCYFCSHLCVIYLETILSREDILNVSDCAKVPILHYK